jgi:hypothetical protein
MNVDCILSPISQKDCPPNFRSLTYGSPLTAGSSIPGLVATEALDLRIKTVDAFDKSH